MRLRDGVCSETFDVLMDIHEKAAYGFSFIGMRYARMTLRMFSVTRQPALFSALSARSPNGEAEARSAVTLFRLSRSRRYRWSCVETCDSTMLWKASVVVTPRWTPSKVAAEIRFPLFFN